MKQLAQYCYGSSMEAVETGRHGRHQDHFQGEQKIVLQTFKLYKNIFMDRPKIFKTEEKHF
jgi:hypothetical protein